MQYLFNTFNSFVSYSKSIGIGLRVWAKQKQEDCYVGGGAPTLTNFPVGCVIQAGTPAKIDETTRVVTIHTSFEVYETAAQSATSIKVKKNINNSVAHASMYVMVAPATVTGTGTGIQVTAVNTSNKLYDVFTVAALAAEIPAGTILVEADKSGASAVTLVVPNGLITDDIYKGEFTTQYSCNVAFAGAVYARRIPPVSAAIQASLNKIQFLNNK